MAELKSNLAYLEEKRQMQRKEVDTMFDELGPQTQSTDVSKQHDFRKALVQEIVRSLHEKLPKIQSDSISVIRINFLPNKVLKAPIQAVVERDEEIFLARALEIPLYGQGEDVVEAVDSLKCEIESLYDDLMEDDNFTDEWLKIKEFLKSRIVS
jgi:hypothetical protein